MNQDGRPAAPLSWEPGPAGLRGRIGRAAAFAGPGFVLAVGGHRLAGGAVSPDAAAAVLGAFVVLGLLVAGARERSGRFVATLVLSSQLAAHLLLAAPMLAAMVRQRTGRLSTATLEMLLLCRHGHSPVSGAALRRAASSMDLGQLRSDAAGPAMTGGPHLGSVVAAAAPMLAAHLTAAAVLAWWLRRGERAVWAAARRVVVTVASLVTGAPALPGRPQVWVPATDVTFARVSQWLLPLSRRGPPSAAEPPVPCL